MLNEKQKHTVLSVKEFLNCTNVQINNQLMISPDTLQISLNDAILIIEEDGSLVIFVNGSARPDFSGSLVLFCSNRKVNVKAVDVFTLDYKNNTMVFGDKAIKMQNDITKQHNIQEYLEDKKQEFFLRNFVGGNA